MRSPTPTAARAATDTSVSHRVVEAVANEEGIPPHDLDQPLNEVVDPDALDDLFRADGTIETVEFSYHGYAVVVRGAGRVAVRSPSE